MWDKENKSENMVTLFSLLKVKINDIFLTFSYEGRNRFC